MIIKGQTSYRLAREISELRKIINQDSSLNEVDRFNLEVELLEKQVQYSKLSSFRESSFSTDVLSIDKAIKAAEELMSKAPIGLIITSETTASYANKDALLMLVGDLYIEKSREMLSINDAVVLANNKYEHDRVLANAASAYWTLRENTNDKNKKYELDLKLLDVRRQGLEYNSKSIRDIFGTSATDIEEINQYKRELDSLIERGHKENDVSNELLAEAYLRRAFSHDLYRDSSENHELKKMEDIVFAYILNPENKRLLNEVQKNRLSQIRSLAFRAMESQGEQIDELYGEGHGVWRTVKDAAYSLFQPGSAGYVSLLRREFTESTQKSNYEIAARVAQATRDAQRIIESTGMNLNEYMSLDNKQKLATMLEAKYGRSISMNRIEEIATSSSNSEEFESRLREEYPDVLFSIGDAVNSVKGLDITIMTDSSFFELASLGSPEEKLKIARMTAEYLGTDVYADLHSGFSESLGEDYLRKYFPDSSEAFQSLTGIQDLRLTRAEQIGMLISDAAILAGVTGGVSLASAKGLLDDVGMSLFQMVSPELGTAVTAIRTGKDVGQLAISLSRSGIRLTSTLSKKLEKVEGVKFGIPKKGAGTIDGTVDNIPIAYGSKTDFERNAYTIDYEQMVVRDVDGNAIMPYGGLEVPDDMDRIEDFGSFLNRQEIELNSRMGRDGQRTLNDLHNDARRNGIEGVSGNTGPVTDYQNGRVSLDKVNDVQPSKAGLSDELSQRFDDGTLTFDEVDQLNEAQRLAYAERMLGRKLTDVERRGVLAAHYSEPETGRLFAKGHVLSEAGIKDRAEWDVLMDNGIVGKNKFFTVKSEPGRRIIENSLDKSYNQIYGITAPQGYIDELEDAISKVNKGETENLGRFELIDEGRGKYSLYDENLDMKFNLESGHGAKKSRMQLTSISPSGLISEGSASPLISLRSRDPEITSHTTQQIVTEIQSHNNGNLVISKEFGKDSSIDWTNADRFRNAHGGGGGIRAHGRFTVLDNVDETMAKAVEQVSLGHIKTDRIKGHPIVEVSTTATIYTNGVQTGKKKVIVYWPVVDSPLPNIDHRIRFHHGEYRDP